MTKVTVCCTQHRHISGTMYTCTCLWPPSKTTSSTEMVLELETWKQLSGRQSHRENLDIVLFLWGFPFGAPRTFPQVSCQSSHLIWQPLWTESSFKNLKLRAKYAFLCITVLKNSDKILTLIVATYMLFFQIYLRLGSRLYTYIIQN